MNKLVCTCQANKLLNYRHLKPFDLAKGSVEYLHPYGTLAQLVRAGAVNRKILGSNPRCPANPFMFDNFLLWDLIQILEIIYYTFFVWCHSVTG